MSTLALNGGAKTIPRPFSRYNSIGAEEAEAAAAVLRTGVLSRFLGSWDQDFYGGDKVREFERAWCEFFGCPHAVSVNSNTSGLIAALGAIGLEPGDEVIVSPWTMSASATAILVWNAIPVFADIEEQTFNLDPMAVERAISPRTRAIVAVDIFGHAADLEALMPLARRHGLKVIEDCAQAPGALCRGRYAGTIADIGVFSLNYHKHIHTGEGGVCVTADDRLAERMRLIRNHAEAVVGDKGETDLVNMLGFNFRLSEVSAAIGLEQLRKLPALVADRQRLAARLSGRLRDLTGLRPPVVRENCTHVYYVYPLLYDPAATGVPRSRIIAALRAEGVPVSGGYQNIHLLPMYQKRTVYGRHGFPWSAFDPAGAISYDKGICPVAESLHDSRYIGLGMCLYAYTDGDIDLIGDAFAKVWAHLPDLRNP